MPNQNRIFKCPAEILKQLAEKRDAQAIELFLKDYGVNVVGERGHCAVTLLAIEGNVEAAEFLIKNYNAARDRAMLGFAIGGHEEQVIQQERLGASSIQVMIGRGYRNHQAPTVDALKNLSDDDLIPYALGAALAGHLHFETILATISCQEKRREGLGLALRRLAWGGHDHLISQVGLISQLGYENVAVDRVMGLGIRGEIKKAYDYIETLPEWTESEKWKLKWKVVRAAAFGGHLAIVKEHLENAKHVSIAIRGDQILEESIAAYFASSNDFALVNTFLNQCPNPSASACMLDLLQFQIPWHDALKGLSLVDNDEAREILKKHINTGSNKKFDAEQCLVQATEINMYMRKQRVDFKSAYQAVMRSTFSEKHKLMGPTLWQKISNRINFGLAPKTTARENLLLEKLLQDDPDERFNAISSSNYR